MTRAPSGTPRPGRRRRLAVLLVPALAVAGLSVVAVPVVAVSAVGASAAATAPTTATGAATGAKYAVAQPLCPPATTPLVATCMGERLVPATRTTPGARRLAPARAASVGPAGGYTPADLASAYDFDPTLDRAGQTVALIEWYDDPSVRGDLDVFDQHYGYPAETATTFRTVNQAGTASPLPRRSDSSGFTETALDVESVRAVCHTCKILLVEATSASMDDLVAAENTAYRLGATEISNSWGSPEGPASTYPKSVLAAFDRPGVVITASSGDDGWYGWDLANDSQYPTDGAPSFPASDPDVVAVAGTRLTIDANGTRSSESVWNENGPTDSTGYPARPTRANPVAPRGASGGGCSTVFAAPAWQRAAAGYAAAGCDGMRLAADVAATADPGSAASGTGVVGFDVYDSLGSHGWVTVGGTSLAAPVIAAMWALAGGAKGQTHPVQTLYDNYRVRASSSFYDVVSGGNSWCGGATLLACEAYVGELSGGTTTNPNVFARADDQTGPVDCSFGTSASAAPPVAPSSACNATTGYDGASGLGAPLDLTAFKSPLPTGTIRVPSVPRLRSSGRYSVAASDPASATIVGTRWTWGDGSAASTGTDVTHAYRTAGTRTVTVTLTDSLGQTGTLTRKVTVGTPLKLVIGGPQRFRAHTAHTFSAAGSTDPNTGATIVAVHWRFGDGSGTVSGRSATHRWTKAGTYPVTMTARDDAGVTTSVTRKVTVRG